MSFFQESVKKKYVNELNKELLDDKFRQFQSYFNNPEIQENIRKAKEEQFQEGFLRELFVNIFDYTLNPHPNYNLTTELKNIANSKKVDGAILKGDDAVAVIELKGTDTSDLDKVEAQAFGYKSHNPKCNYVIISNFEKLRFYISNAVEHISFNLFRLTREQFAVMWLCLAKDNLLNDIPLKMKESSLMQEENITKKLYADYSKFRNAIFSNLVIKNPEIDKLLLFKKTQKLLDRFLFIFFAEDRLLIPPNSIREIINQWETLRDVLDEYMPLYDRFKKFFNYLNTGYKGKNYEVFAYNGGLFEPDEILDNITIDDNILYEHTLKLTQYDFDTEVDVNILGHIFEHSLSEIENVQAEIRGEKVETQKSKRKKDGIFYTPKYITKYIVENTVGKLCLEKREEIGIIDEEYAKGRKNRKRETILELDKKVTDYRNWLLNITILDPACGSGAFLNQALDFLIYEHQKIDNLRAALFEEGLVFADITNDILENNIYGVDINEESVEIAKLSLWLRTAQVGRKLNSLSKNIKCGNSLIDDPAVAGDKAFNWEKEFPVQMSAGGFDVVIGNPPYVRADTDDAEFIKQREWLTNNYETLYEKWDLMTAFFEKSLKLLKDNGSFGFIASNSITTSKFAFRLQDWIINNFKIRSIDYYDDFVVFQNVGVVPITIIVDKDYSNKNGIIEKFYRKSEFENYQIKKIDLSKLESHNIEELRSQIFKKEFSKSLINVKNELLGNICYISVGMVINADEIKSKGEFSKDDLISEFQDEIHSRMYVEGKNIKRYKIDEYKFLEWNTDRVPNKLRRPTFPELYQGDKILRGRVTEGLFDNTGIICNDSIVVFKKYLDLEGINNLSINNSITKNGNRKRNELEEISKQYDLKYLLAIINSKFALKYLNNIRKHRLENYFYPDDFRKLPIPNISPEAQLPFIELADIMLEKNKELKEKENKFLELLKAEFNIQKLSTKIENWSKHTWSDFEQELKKAKITLSGEKKEDWFERFNRYKSQTDELKSIIDMTDRKIDQLVYQLYELTEEEINIVEGE
ncbi:MAG: N-6 DNA methylase, partial [Candidatus Kapabacteria bacterium]|nr:N-6 DNA methylase [Ignavibacteriota bacterium]MCW5886176.1 N-6 DNA methylase [Candidatus Kapabacteria bacterium]